MEQIKDLRKEFSIPKLRELALEYNSYPEDSEKNLIGNIAIREFLKWIENTQTIISEEKKENSGE